jgi:DNA-binding transcriptional LysR family regulator
VKLQGLRAVHAVVASGYSITKAAELLHLSQSVVSRYVLETEQALTTALFKRSRNRLVGLTPAGEVLMPMIDTALAQLDELPRAAGRLAAGEAGSLSVATSPTYARYLLPPLIERFIRECPAVTLRLRQGFVDEVAQWVSLDEVDVSVSAIHKPALPNVAYYRLREVHRVVLAPVGHPLLRR